MSSGLTTLRGTWTFFPRFPQGSSRGWCAWRRVRFSVGTAPCRTKTYAKNGCTANAGLCVHAAVVPVTGVQYASASLEASSLSLCGVTNIAKSTMRTRPLGHGVGFPARAVRRRSGRWCSPSRSVSPAGTLRPRWAQNSRPSAKSAANALSGSGTNPQWSQCTIGNGSPSNAA